MIKVEHMEAWGFEHAVRGARNPMNSWRKSDSGECGDTDCDTCPFAPVGLEACMTSPSYIIGPADMDLMQRLYKAGPEHRKYLRQIFVSMDITAPLYFWKEFDTYKVGTVSNSCSTMHKIAAKEFELDDFSREHLFKESDEEMTPEYYAVEGYMFSPLSGLEILRDILNACRQKYLETKDKKWWWQLIQLLPSSYNQKRTITMNYETAVTIINQRTGHKLDEWNDLIMYLKERLPYLNEIMTGGINANRYCIGDKVYIACLDDLFPEESHVHEEYVSDVSALGMIEIANWKDCCDVPWADPLDPDEHVYRTMAEAQACVDAFIKERQAGKNGGEKKDEKQ